MIVVESDIASSQSLRPRQKKAVTREEHNTALAQASAPHKSLSSAFASQAEISEKYLLRKSVEAVSRPVLEAFFRSLKV